MVDKINNNISFKARFLFNGTKKDTNSFVKFITTEIADTIEHNSPISLMKQNNSTMVLTSLDCNYSNEIHDFINADNFYDKNKKGFLTGIIDFDPVLGFYEKIHSQIRNGITSYFKTEHFSQKKKLPPREQVPKLDFKKAVALENALNIVFHKIKHLGGQDLTEYQEAIRQYDKFQDLKVKGLVGIGQYSLILDIDKDLALKLSMYPCYPKKLEKFDLPIIDKGWIPLPHKTLYYCITPKYKNLFDGKIKRQDVIKIMDAIENKKYEINDILPSHYKQIVMSGNKPFLCDYDCAKLHSGESRLFKANRTDWL